MKKSKHNFKVMHFVFVFALVSVISFSIGFNNNPWDADPNFDGIPQEVLDNLNQHPQTPDNFMSDPVTDADGYDNFYLGVDFAEGHISMNPNNPQQMFVAYNINNTWYTNNGHDWYRNNPSFPSSSGDPVTAYDGAGNLYYDNMKSPISGTWVVKSTNNSTTWSSALTFNTGNDKNWIAADQTNGSYQNYVYGVMTNSGTASFSRSTNQGASFSFVQSMSPHSLPGAMVAVGPYGSTNGGAVYAVTNSGSAFSSTYTFFRSTNGGASLTSMSSQNFSNYVGTNVSGRNSVQNMRTRPYPFIAADNSSGTYRGRLYIVYASNQPAGNGNKPDIFCRYSTNGGTTFSSEVRVNDDANSQNHNQWHPAIWCDVQTGRLYVQWMDTRDTPTSDSALIYASYSDDGGQTFVTNQKISNKKMRINCSSCGGGGTPRYQGDYNGIVSNSKVSALTWADFRNNNFASYVAYFPDYAMKLSTASITIPGSGGNQTVQMQVPSVKLYSDNVQVSHSISPTPGAGNINIGYPSGQTLSSPPGNLPIQITTSGGVPNGNYTLTVTSQGPNGTPVHKRELTINVGGGGGSSAFPESFESVTFPPPGWGKLNPDGGPGWNRQTVGTSPLPGWTGGVITAPPGGENAVAFCTWNTGGSSDNDQWLYTPQISGITSSDSLTFWMKRTYSAYLDEVQVRLSTTTPTVGGFSNLLLTKTYQAGNDDSNWTRYSIPLGAYAGQSVYIAWREKVTDNFTNGAAISLDLVNITGTVLNVSGEEIPLTYSLSQNFPNPFNPMTTIKYSVASETLVTLKIFDITGHEVATLVNSPKMPGNYEVNFNASNLSSGVYFYKLEAGDFIDTKRMLLVK